MTRTLSRVVCVLVLGISSVAIATQKQSIRPERSLVTGDFRWVSSQPLVHAQEADGEKWHSVKDPSIVRFNNRWHLTQPGGHWTDSISHGELIRSGYDQELAVNPKALTFLFQGVSDQERQRKSYGEIPWRLGLLELR